MVHRTPRARRACDRSSHPSERAGREGQAAHGRAEAGGRGRERADGGRASVLDDRGLPNLSRLQVEYRLVDRARPPGWFAHPNRFVDLGGWGCYRLGIRTGWWEDDVQVEILAALAAWVGMFDYGNWTDPEGKARLILQLPSYRELLRGGASTFQPDAHRGRFEEHLRGQRGCEGAVRPGTSAEGHGF